MNETKEKEEKDAKEENFNETGGSKLMSNQTEEIIISDDSVEEDSCLDAQGPAEDGNSVLFRRTEDVEHEGMEEEGQKAEQEEGEDRTQYTNLDELLAVWWEYKRTHKLKKKKKKTVEIFRDENYWTDGRYTDDEDFNYLQA